MLRRIRQAGINVSMKRIYSELDTLREVINVYPRKRGQKEERKQTVLSKASELQQKLISVLGLRFEGNGNLG